MTKKSKRIIFLSMIVLLPLLLFVYRDWVFKGKISITAELPYEVDIPGMEPLHCETDPCEISLPAGIYDLIFTKPQHRSVITTFEVNSFQTTEKNIYFQILPRILDVNSSPELEEKEYELLIDQLTGFQKLVLASDENSLPIVFFKRPLTSPRLITSTNHVLIISEDGNYLVDLRKKSRERVILDLSIVEQGEISLEGEYLFFKHRNGSFWVLDFANERLLALDLTIEFDQAAWVEGGRLAFVSNQQFSNIGISNGLLDIIELNFNPAANYLFAYYYPQYDIYQKIAEPFSLEAEPRFILPTSSGSEIYFEIGEKVQKLVVGI